MGNVEEDRLLAAKSAAIVLAILLLGASLCPADDDRAREPSESSMLISKIHMWRGNQYERGGRLDLATENYLKASAYLRTSPDPHFALARVYLRRSIMDAFLEIATGVKLLMSDFFYQSLVLSNLLVVVIIAVALAFYIAAIVIVIRHAKTLWLSAIISIPARLKGSYPNMIVVVSVLSFFLLLSGQSLPSIITWTTVVGCAMVWRFANASERRTIAGFVVFLIIIGFAFSFTGRIVSTQHPQSQLRTAALADRISEERLQQAFAASDRKSRYEPIVDFMRGYMLLRSGEYSAAIERLNLTSKFASNNAAIQNNLGVAYHGLGRYQQAGVQFKNALRLAPREAVIHYNYSQTLNALLHYDLAQEELAEASALDFDLTRSLVTKKEASSPVPMNLQTRVLWQMALDYDDAVVKLDYHPIEAGAAGTLTLIIVAGAAFALMRKAKCPARCEVCGCVVGTQMTKRKRKDRLCPTCHKLRLLNANDHRELEAQYDRRLRMLATRSVVLRIVLGLAVPGTSYHLAGKRFRGFMSSVVVIALLVLALGGGAVIRAVPVFRTEPTIKWALLLFVIAYAIYAWRSSVTAIRSVKEE
jgi:tetratricopeptide (TPR) repeat protein